MTSVTTLVRKNAAAKMVGWHPAHMMKVATHPEYADLGFPVPVRIGRNSIAFVLDELQAWMQQRIDERDSHGYQPKQQNPRENHRRALERMDGQGA